MKYRFSYQENTALEEVARDRPPMGDAPDTESFQKILRRECLMNEE